MRPVTVRDNRLLDFSNFSLHNNNNNFSPGEAVSCIINLKGLFLYSLINSLQSFTSIYSDSTTQNYIIFYKGNNIKAPFWYILLKLKYVFGL